MFKPKKILVTGGGGFLGATLIEALLEHKKQQQSDLQILSMDLLPALVPGVEHHTGSILDVTDLLNVVQGCDVVVHLAALLGVENSERRRLDCLHINIQGTINVLNACALERVKKVIFASSSEVYGEQVKLPISEENPLNPKSIYAVTKLAGEEYTRAYAERYGFAYTILRYFNAYGANQVGQFVMARFVNAVLEDQSPMLSGDGGQVRSFCHARDIAAGTLAAILNDKANGQIINIGSDKEPISMKDLAERVIRLSGKSGLQARVMRQDQMDRKPERDIRSRIPSLDKARRLLGYEPKVSLDEGIRDLLESGKGATTWAKR